MQYLWRSIASPCSIVFVVICMRLTAAAWSSSATGNNIRSDSVATVVLPPWRLAHTRCSSQRKRRRPHSSNTCISAVLLPLISAAIVADSRNASLLYPTITCKISYDHIYLRSKNIWSCSWHKFQTKRERYWRSKIMKKLQCLSVVGYVSIECVVSDRCGTCYEIRHYNN